VLARGVEPQPDDSACYAAARRLADVAWDSALVVQQPDGHWRWIVNDPDGRPLAESPPVFRDAASCGRALSEVRRAAKWLPDPVGWRREGLAAAGPG
jgi:hypothetical protein